MEVDDGTSKKRKLKDEEDTQPIKKQTEAKKLPEPTFEEKWGRPPLSPTTNGSQNINIQLMEFDYHMGDPVPGMPGLTKGKVPIMRCYGISEDRNSVQINVHGFYPYIIVEPPPWCTENHIPLFITALNSKVKEEGTETGESKVPVVLDVVVVSGKSIMYYRPGSNKEFWKVYAKAPQLIPSIRTAIEQGISMDGTNMVFMKSYEADIPFVLRAMVDMNLSGGTWVSLEPKKHSLVGKYSNSSTSECQIESNVYFQDLKVLGHDNEWSKIGKLKILSFDIECSGRKGVFPEPEKDPVIQIACVVHIHGTEEYRKIVFTFDTCAAIVGSEVQCFDSERALLTAFSKFFKLVDADIVTGYNIINFDFPYLLNRAKTLKLSSFPYLGRIRGDAVRLRDTTFSSKAYGTRESKEVIIHGVIILDMLQQIQRDHKLRSYTLNNVAFRFLMERKEDVHHSQIAALQSGTDIDRQRLAVYCIKDAALPLRIMTKLMLIYTQVEMSRVSGVPLSFLLTKGQQIKGMSLLYREAKKDSMLIPYVPSAEKTGESYVGATVIEPMRGYYDEPIATLDYESLYPRIILDGNMDYSTYIPREQRHLYDPNDYFVSPETNHSFIKEHIRRGILPRILEDLLNARSKAKDDLKKEADTFKKAVLDGRQLALKVSANSMYGFTGAKFGKLPLQAIAESVTDVGRDMLNSTKAFIESRNPECTVIAGDTDSVMFKTRKYHPVVIPKEREAAMTNADKAEYIQKAEATMMAESIKFGQTLAKEATIEVRKKFGFKYANLTFEKVYFPFLLINKKRYAGMWYSKPDKPDKLDKKGLESVRRDNCLLTTESQEKCLDFVIAKRDTEGAKQYMRDIAADLLAGEIDISKLIISKSLSSNPDEYTSKQAHSELGKRMQKRDPLTAPKVGDRVPYVIISGPKNAKAYEKTEDPLYVIDNNIPIDHHYYINNQLLKPTVRLFKPFMENPESLLNGDHTKVRVKSTPTTQGMGKYVIHVLKCLKCNGALPKDLKTVCRNCTDTEEERLKEELRLALAYQSKLSKCEEKFASYWTSCQRCQGSLTNEVICANRDCSIFYARKISGKKVSEMWEKTQRFDTSW